MTSDTLPKTYEPGDFSFIKDSHFQTAMKHAYDETTKMDMWNFFTAESPPDSLGYMFWDCPKVITLKTALDDLDGHSGASLALCLRNIEYIAKNGWDLYLTNMVKTY